jgi:hypothetical protein
MHHRKESYPRKGDIALLGDQDAVNFKIAEQYLGIGARQRAKLIRKGHLRVIGGGMNRVVTTESLIHYVPPKRTELTRTNPN